MSLSSVLKIACNAGCKAVGANFGNRDEHVEDEDLPTGVTISINIRTRSQ
jgi:hypothetical protein